MEKNFNCLNSVHTFQFYSVAMTYSISFSSFHFVSITLEFAPPAADRIRRCRNPECKLISNRDVGAGDCIAKMGLRRVLGMPLPSRLRRKYKPRPKNDEEWDADLNTDTDTEELE